MNNDEDEQKEIERRMRQLERRDVRRHILKEWLFDAALIAVAALLLALVVHRGGWIIFV